MTEKVEAFFVAYGSQERANSAPEFRNGSLRGQRPRSLTRLVLVAVSSMNTNLAGSSRPCLRNQRRRARATSARSCSVARRLFFDGDIMPLEKSPDRGATAWNSLLAHRRNNLVQGQIRLFGYQSQQPFHVPSNGDV